MANTHNTIKVWAKEHDVEAQELIDYLASIGKPGMKANQNIPQDVLVQVEEHFKPAEPPKGKDEPTDPPKEEGKKDQGTTTNPADISVTPDETSQNLSGTTMSVSVNPVVTALLNQKPVVSGTMTEEELKKFTTSSQPPKSAAIDATEIVKAKIAAAIAAKQNVPAPAPAPMIEHVSTSDNDAIPNAEVETGEGYYFDPHPAWGYAAAAVGGAGLLVLLAKIFGGK